MQQLQHLVSNAKIFSACMHSGCDTVSFPCGNGKLTALKVIQNNDITGLDTVLGREDATLDKIKKTAEEFFRALYGQKKAASFNDARCRVYK